LRNCSRAFAASLTGFLAIIRKIARTLLAAEGFTLSVVHDGDEALYALGRHHFDLVVLPRMGGLDVLRLLRQKLTTPVLMLTARGEEVDRVVGLELGADDYLPKPSIRASWWRACARSCGAV